MTRSRRSERGFTLIELMVVVLIIGILLAIAIPTFLGARSRSQDAVAKSSLRNGTTAVLAGAIAGVDEPDATSITDLLSRLENSVDWVEAPTASGGPKEISVDLDNDGWGGFAARSESGTCFYAKGMDGGAGDVTWRYGSSDTADCTGSEAETNATNSQF